MGAYISMLRGVNVGKNQVKMEELRSLYQSLGFEGVASYVQSGNVIFVDSERTVPAIKSEIEKGIRRRFGFDSSVFIRTPAEVKTILRKNPFAGRDETKLHVTFLSDAPAGFPLEEMKKVKDEAEDLSASGREIYLFCPNGYGKTKLSNSFFEKKLKLTATTRNWRTVNALLALAEA